MKTNQTFIPHPFIIPTLSLPPEIWMFILEHLSAIDLGNFALTAKYNYDFLENGAGNLMTRKALAQSLALSDFKTTQQLVLKRKKQGNFDPIERPVAVCQITNQEGDTIFFIAHRQELVRYDVRLGTSQVYSLLPFSKLLPNFYMGKVVPTQLLVSSPNQTYIAILVSAFRDDGQMIEIMILDTQNGQLYKKRILSGVMKDACLLHFTDMNAPQLLFQKRLNISQQHMNFYITDQVKVWDLTEDVCKTKAKVCALGILGANDDSIVYPYPVFSEIRPQ